jgi:PEP-CTERM motif-containing protein
MSPNSHRRIVYCISWLVGSFVIAERSYGPPPGVPADYNDYGTVDTADFVLWSNGGPLGNEVDAPGTVNAADYTAWRARYGNTSSGAAASLNSTPEPTTLLMMAMATVAAIATRRRRRGR